MYIIKGLDEWYEQSAKTDEHKKVYKYYKERLAEANSGNLSAIVLPKYFDWSLEKQK